jgi:hypothetical protein
MWIGGEGQVVVEANWDDPWVIFDPGLEERVRGLSETDLDELESDLWAMFFETMEATREHFRNTSPEDERPFAHAELTREAHLFGTPDQNMPIGPLITGQIVARPWRWRLDVIQTTLDAIGQLAAEA